MRKTLILAGLMMIPLLMAAQPEKKALQYSMSGFRHGINYFPVVKYSCVQYEPGDNLTFDTYHSLEVICSWLRRWEKEYPGLVELYEVDRSFEGRPILQMTITNKGKGKDTDKPAAFFEGGRHSGEVTSSECVMWMAQYLLENYGRDPDVTHLLNTKTIYLRPVNDATGRRFTQGGAGEFPLSESETRAVVSFLLTHPNVYVVNSMDTSVPMHLRPPSISASADRMYTEDLEWYRIFDDLGKKLTGYEKAGDVYNDYGEGNPLFGHGPDFGYWYFGAIWYGDEIWNGARYKDYDNNGTTDQVDILRWDDEENGGEGFIEWKSASHPVYGEIETGGFNPKFFSQNPPARHLGPWVRNEGLFNIEMAKHLPELDWGRMEVRRIKAWKTDSADYQLKISVVNRGKLPTALKQAHLVKIVREDRIELEFDTTGLSKEKPSFRMIGEKKNGTGGSGRGMYDDQHARQAQVKFTRNIPYTPGGSATETVFTIRLYNISELKGKASVISTRRGVLSGKEFIVR